MLGAGILVVFAALAAAPELFVGPLQTAVTANGGRLDPPAPGFPLGTDEIGRDILNLTVHGARVSMVIGLMATVITVVIGAVVGIVAGFVGGRLDGALMRVTDFFLVIPTFVLALILTPIIRDLVGSGSREVFGIRMTLIVIVIVIGGIGWSATAGSSADRRSRCANGRSWTGRASSVPGAVRSCAGTSFRTSST